MFSEIMRELLISEDLLIQDSLEYIKTHHQNQVMHVVSGSDGEELRYLCERLGLSEYFESIHGSPTPKPSLIKALLDSEKYPLEDVLMIGDAHNDRDAAMVNRIAFAGYNNEALRSLSGMYLDSFTKFIYST
jgi:phosphoglycolate phosphatase-like HAD superfamily hydrolase